MDTPEVYHISVLLGESVDALVTETNGTYVDVTFGGGGHSREILRRLTAGGHLYSFDQDKDAEANANIDDERFTFVRSNFRYLKNWMRYYGVEGVDGILADLGVSSHHFDDETRGFSFRFDSALDMRMNGRGGRTAADVLNTYDEEQLARIFHLYGEIKAARKLAQLVVKKRAEKPIATTGEFMELVKVIEPQRKGKDGGLFAQAFQALRIEVNHEMEALEEMLMAAIECLKPGGRLVVLTYHSLEDRMVKNVMRAGNLSGQVEQDFYGNRLSPLKALSGKAIVPSAEEQQANPRSRSAKLRIAVKL